MSTFVYLNDHTLGAQVILRGECRANMLCPSVPQLCQTKKNNSKRTKALPSHKSISRPKKVQKQTAPASRATVCETLGSLQSKYPANPSLTRPIPPGWSHPSWGILPTFVEGIVEASRHPGVGSVNGNPRSPITSRPWDLPRWNDLFFE